MRARWYDPASRTFPAARWRTSESNPEVPLSNHVYSYGLDNPVLYTDPFGTCSGPGCGKSGQQSEGDFYECQAQGGRWEPLFKKCHPGWPVPPPNNDDTPQQGGRHNPTPSYIDPLLPMPMVGTGTLGLPRGGAQEEDALIKAGLCTAAALSLMDGLSKAFDKVRDWTRTRRNNDWELVGYHGTSSLYEAAILTGINPQNEGLLRRLGPGFYTTPDLEIAQEWAYANTMLTNGGAMFGDNRAVVFAIYARNFRRMKGLEVQEVPSGNVPKEWITDPDYLVAPMAGFNGIQIKFNPHTYTSLRAVKVWDALQE